MLLGLGSVRSLCRKTFPCLEDLGARWLSSVQDCPMRSVITLLENKNCLLLSALSKNGDATLKELKEESLS